MENDTWKDSDSRKGMLFHNDVMRSHRNYILAVIESSVFHVALKFLEDMHPPKAEYLMGLKELYLSSISSDYE